MENKSTPPIKNLIASATDYPSSLISFSNSDGTTMGFILVKSEATNIMDATSKSKPGNDITSETI